MGENYESINQRPKTELFLSKIKGDPAAIRAAYEKLNQKFVELTKQSDPADLFEIFAELNAENGTRYHIADLIMFYSNILAAVEKKTSENQELPIEMKNRVLEIEEEYAREMKVITRDYI